MTDYRARLGEQRTAGEQKRHRHAWVSCNCALHDAQEDRDCCCVGGTACRPGVHICRLCGAIKDEAKSRKGRSARSRGNRRELEIARQLGGEKVGQYQGPEDIRTPLLNVQSKVRKAFPYWMVVELDKLPRSGGRLPALVVTDAPGQGHERQSIVVMHLADFTDLHGRVDE